MESEMTQVASLGVENERGYLFQPGKSGNPAGKPKGAVNKTTTEFKQALNMLLEHAAPKMIEWLDRIAVDDPNRALDHVGRLAEYVYPKLQRTDNTNTNIGIVQIVMEAAKQYHVANPPPVIESIDNPPSLPTPDE